MTDEGPMTEILTDEEIRDRDRAAEMLTDLRACTAEAMDLARGLRDLGAAHHWVEFHQRITPRDLSIAITHLEDALLRLRVGAPR